jgi:hypothetical protein
MEKAARPQDASQPDQALAFAAWQHAAKAGQAIKLTRQRTEHVTVNHLQVGRIVAKDVKPGAGCLCCGQQFAVQPPGDPVAVAYTDRQPVPVCQACAEILLQYGVSTSTYAGKKDH